VARTSTNRTLRVPERVARLLRSLHPDLRRRVRATLQHVRDEPASGKPLRDELAGLRSYRVSRFRIVYREAEDSGLEVVAVGPRETIYEETFRLLHRDRP
jgi:mRNA interferase RelE/StbE